MAQYSAPSPELLRSDLWKALSISYPSVVSYRAVGRCSASRTASAVTTLPRPASRAAISSPVSACRASPPVLRTSTSSASGSISTRPPSPRSGSSSARRTTARTSSSVSGSSTSTRERERTAALISKPGCSVVAPTSVISPDSIHGRRKSCCPLFSRWISSMKSSVRRPPRRLVSASFTTSRSRGTPSLTALKGTKADPLSAATIRPSVVFPLPGGP